MPQRGQRPIAMGQNNRQTQRPKDPNKPINATEVKSYINAWATKKKLKVRLVKNTYLTRDY